MRRYGTLAAVAAALLLMPWAANAELVDWYQPGDDAYLSFDDSPWTDTAGELDYFWLEDFEDGLFNSPGLAADAGFVRAPSGATDSVDGDDGLVDGFGYDGWSYKEYNPDGASIMFTFDAETLGVLPTHAGLVWTDGNGAALVYFEVYGPDGYSLGSFQSLLGDGFHNGSTDADRFLGAEYSGGISAMRVWAEFGSLEVDHVQYGASIVPAPSAALALLTGLGLRRRRRR